MLATLCSFAQQRNTFNVPTWCPMPALSHAGTLRETILIDDGLASQQHIVNRDGIAEFLCHNSTDASAGKLVLLTSSGGYSSTAGIIRRLLRRLRR